MGEDIIVTIYGRFKRSSKKRLDMTFDYESAEINAFKKCMELIKPLTFLDVGANIGVYSVFLSDINSIEEVLAFEPSPIVYQLLSENLLLQENASRLKCLPSAVSNEIGVTFFSMFGDMAGSNSISKTSFMNSKERVEEIRVDTLTLDSILKHKETIFGCKVDVEGHELNVIEGASEFLKNNTGLLQIECFDNVDVLQNLLLSYGYEMFFRIKHDYYFVNIMDGILLDKMKDIFFTEVTKSMNELKELKRKRRKILRSVKVAFDNVKFGKDPILK